MTLSERLTGFDSVWQRVTELTLSSSVKQLQVRLRIVSFFFMFLNEILMKAVFDQNTKKVILWNNITD